MAFGKSDQSKIASLLSTVTTTIDGLGRSSRDIWLVLKWNQHWPLEVRHALENYAAAIYNLMLQASSLESDVIARVNEVLPPGE